MTLKEASLYEAPFEYVKAVVLAERQNRREKRQLTHWWLHARPSPKYRQILRVQKKYVGTAVTSKHRVFVWLTPEYLVDHQIVVFAFENDYSFGVLQSKVHDLWSRKLSTQTRDAASGTRYTPSTAFETFPFPWPPGREPSEADSPLVRNIAEAARKLVQMRDAWLNPPGASEADLKKRTLTNLYNQRPAWLDNAHRALDEAVFAAYGWPATLTREEILARLLALNHERAAAQGVNPQRLPTHTFQSQ